MSYSVGQIQTNVCQDQPGITKGATPFDGALQGYAAQIAGNSKDALECGAPRKHVAELEAWTVNKARNGHAESAIKFQARVLKSLAPAGTDAVNGAGLAVGIESQITDFFTEVSPNVFVFRLRDFLDQIQAIQWSHGLRG